MEIKNINLKQDAVARPYLGKNRPKNKSQEDILHRSSEAGSAVRSVGTRDAAPDAVGRGNHSGGQLVSLTAGLAGGHAMANSPGDAMRSSPMRRAGSPQIQREGHGQAMVPMPENARDQEQTAPCMHKSSRTDSRCLPRAWRR